MWNQSSIENAEGLLVEHGSLQENSGDHEIMHPIKAIFLLKLAFIFHLIFLKWKKQYFDAYLRLFLFAAWVVPVKLSLNNGWKSFTFTWLFYTMIMCYIVNQLRKPSTTQRYLSLVLFYGIYQVTVTIVAFGPLTITSIVLLGNTVEAWLANVVLISVAYGFYYALVTRGIARIIIEKMAIEPLNMGMEQDNKCRLCNNSYPSQDIFRPYPERAVTLDCRHTFHELCFGVWSLLGNKLKCPLCEEEVNVEVFDGPTLSENQLYLGEALDIIHHLLAWVPFLFTAKYLLSGLYTKNWWEIFEFEAE